MNKAFSISLLIFHSFFVSSTSSSDTLRQGEELNSSSYLVSPESIFTLGFYNSYLGIWYTNYSLHPVWLANRNMPVYKDSAIFTISKGGEVIITSNGDDPIKLYAAESGTNITATLLDSGNFVVKEVDSNRVLWQSFDYPTDVLLPGMKLGVDHKTGKNWMLTSWFSARNPACGAFTLEWDTIMRRLIVKRHGMVYWTSGDLKLYYPGNDLKLHAFDYIIRKPDALDYNYKFMNVTNEDEEYFTYSLFQVPYLTTEQKNVVSGWRLGYQGVIDDYKGQVSIARVDKCYGYSNNYDLNGEIYMGCEFWEVPKCRNRYQRFSLERGKFDFTVDYFYDNSSNLSHSDCRAACWNDCNCIGFVEEEIGCSYWSGENARLITTYEHGRDPIRYVLRSYVPKKRRVWMWIIISVAIVVVLLLILGSAALFLVRKYRKGFVGQRKKSDELQELQELMKLEGYTEETEFETNGDRGTHLKQFTYASILASTNCFALDNKLGEGGFGPVYKGKMPEGREIAIKLLSRRSEQGLVEFKTELILISKL